MKYKSSNEHIIALDGIRGFAIIAVMIFHYMHMSSELINRTWLNNVTNSFDIFCYGVDSFFVLSGFLITGILLDNLKSPHYFRNFYARRSLRTFPLYYCYLFFLYLITKLPQPMWTFLFHISNWRQDLGIKPLTSQLWSLAVEEQFYFIWPVIIRFMPIKYLGFICLVIFFGSFIAGIVADEMGASLETLHRGTPFAFDAIASGAFLAFITRYNIPLTLSLQKYSLLILFASILLLCIFQYFASNGQGLVINRLFISIITAALILLVISKSKLVNQIFEQKLLIIFGKYSYGLYVLHGITFYLCNSYFKSLISNGSLAEKYFSIAWPIMLVITFLMSLVTVYLSWLIIESPFLKLKTIFRN